jgi:hypothetical protein
MGIAGVSVHARASSVLGHGVMAPEPLARTVPTCIVVSWLVSPSNRIHADGARATRSGVRSDMDLRLTSLPDIRDFTDWVFETFWGDTRS